MNQDPESDLDQALPMNFESESVWVLAKALDFGVDLKLTDGMMDAEPDPCLDMKLNLALALDLEIDLVLELNLDRDLKFALDKMK